MKFTKITEGRGYIGGDYECWCINPVPFDEINKLCQEALSGVDSDFEEYLEKYEERRVYPNDFVPDELRKHGEPLVQFKVTFEVEIIQGSTPLPSPEVNRTPKETAKMEVSE